MVFSGERAEEKYLIAAAGDGGGQEVWRTIYRFEPGKRWWRRREK